MDIIKFQEINETCAEQLSHWKYHPPLNFYNHKESPEYYLKEENHYRVALIGSEVLGFYCYGKEAQVSGGDYSDDALDFGLGLNPEYIGQGLGRAFLAAVLNDLNKHYPEKKIRLTVADFNERAIKIYKEAGFEKVSSFVKNEKRKFFDLCP